jgi:hypothetical protein
VHQVEQGSQAHWAGLPQDTAALKGRLGFVAMVQPGHAAPLLARLEAGLKMGLDAGMAAGLEAASEAKR